MDEPWMDELRDADGVLRPTAEALPAVQELVRRRRRVRAVGGGLGITGLVAAVIAGAVLVPGSGRPGSAGPVVTTPTETPSPGKVSPNFDCGHGAGRIDVFTATPPPIADRDQQQELIDRILAGHWSGFGVAGAEPTQLGVVVMVTGDYEAARKALLPEGVRQVALTAAELGSIHDQAMNFIQELLQPAVDEVNRKRAGIPGYASIAVWSEGGAIVVDWKAPIPAAISALAGKRSDGVNVIVQPVRYSQGDVQAATRKVLGAIKDHRVDAEWSMSSGCDDGSGLVLGIVPESLGNRKAEVEAQLTEIAGMPVHVQPQERPVF